MQRPMPVLMPVPRHVIWGPGSVTLPVELCIVVTARQQELLPIILRFQQFITLRLGITAPVVATTSGLGTGLRLRIVPDSATVAHAQGYTLSVGQEEILLQAGTAAGAALGLATLKQVLIGSGRMVPEVHIEDYPDFGRRGVMLDLSRGKVPTMADLYRYVDLMADLKINELQLYTEHTFAYQQHREVWQNYSPMTGEQILLLDQYCQDRFIDLVPNQNSFGHMKEWLVHERYHHLAEQLDGWNVRGVRVDGPFSLCPLEPAVLPFLGELYDELLPHFTSPYFNVGCDETFDVGQGRSKEAVEQHGEHRVYIDLLLKIYDLVKARGKVMQFWGDIIIKAPEFIAELPTEQIVALEWGYEANYPFDERCGHYARAGMPFYVCPGTSTWNSLLGRTDNAMGNMRNAAENGLKHGAIGYLNTVWGDRGHQDYEPISYLPIVYGAAVSWAVEQNKEADVKPYLNEVLFGDRSGQIGQLLYDLGNIYKAAGIEPPNGSSMCYLLHFGLSHPRSLGSVEGADFVAAEQQLRTVAQAIDQLALTCDQADLIIAELKNGVRMTSHACRFGQLGQAMLRGETLDRTRVLALALDLDEIMAEHRNLWLQRNRIGGLEEMSLLPLRKIRAHYGKMLQELKASGTR